MLWQLDGDYVDAAGLDEVHSGLLSGVRLGGVGGLHGIALGVAESYAEVFVGVEGCRGFLYEFVGDGSWSGWGRFLERRGGTGGSDGALDGGADGGVVL